MLKDPEKRPDSAEIYNKLTVCKLDQLATNNSYINC